MKALRRKAGNRRVLSMGYKNGCARKKKIPCGLVSLAVWHRGDHHTLGRYDTAIVLSHAGRMTTLGTFRRADCRCC